MITKIIQREYGDGTSLTYLESNGSAYLDAPSDNPEVRILVNDAVRAGVIVQTMTAQEYVAWLETQPKDRWVWRND